MHGKADRFSHFEGKNAAEHLVAARKKGAKASEEIHGAEIPGSAFSFCDTLKETLFLLLSMWYVLNAFNTPYIPNILGAFLLGWTFWKVGRSALLGYHRLERVHNLTQQEKWEIEHHREQEKVELREMYEAKGLKGELLDQVVEILMSDENRLLQVMLEEELGLTLHSYEHPMMQGFGAFFGALIAGGIAAIGVWLSTLPIFLGLTLVPVFGIAWFLAKKVGNDPLRKSIWETGVFLFSFGCIYFLVQALI